MRRYCDANGSHVGELYMEQERHGVRSYAMIGVSLDSLPVDLSASTLCTWRVRPGYDFELDTARDFLAPMPRLTVRVGALDPADNDRVRRMVAALPRRSMTLMVQNRFIEHVLEPKR